MVKFGETLRAHRIEGWRYIDYDALKDLIRRGVSRRVFTSRLIVEIDTVSADFRTRLNADPPASVSELRRAALLSYLAVLKISKKFTKALAKERGADVAASPASAQASPARAPCTPLAACYLFKGC